MKDVLIYGMLVATVIGASVGVIQNLNTTIATQGQTINTNINDSINNLIGVDGDGAGTDSN